MFYFQQFAGKVQFLAIKFFSQTDQTPDEPTDQQTDKPKGKVTTMSLPELCSGHRANKYIFLIPYEERPFKGVL